MAETWKDRKAKKKTEVAAESATKKPVDAWASNRERVAAANANSRRRPRWVPRKPRGWVKGDR